MITQEQLENGMGSGKYHVTAKEMQLAKEYEDLEHTDTVEAYARREKIVQELHDLRERLNNEAEMKYNLAGKGRHNVHAEDITHLDDMTDDEINCNPTFSDKGAGVNRIVYCIDIKHIWQRMSEADRHAYEVAKGKVNSINTKAAETFDIIVMKRYNPNWTRGMAILILSIVNDLSYHAARVKYLRDLKTITNVICPSIKPFSKNN